jgi:hypothetical protein
MTQRWMDKVIWKERNDKKIDITGAISRVVFFVVVA